jgi:16S rRNA (adenine1518-N6/adenine1519-N6)-dimethyltransferase
MSGAATLEHRARKRFGQNFLHDRRVIERIVDAIDPRPGQAIVEIGPGQAALTRELVRRAGHITAIEIDRDLAAWLREQFTPEQLTLVEADALKLDWSSLAAQPLRVVGNLPYNISSPLLFRLMEFAERVIDQHFMLQKEVVDRMVAPPGSKTYGRLSVMLQVRYRLTKLFDVPRGAFNPPPKVTSSIVRMVPRPASELPVIDFGCFGRVVAAAFNQRRKILRNALSEVAGEEAFRTAGVDPLARAETLAVDDFVRLARAVADQPGLPGGKTPGQGPGAFVNR